MASQEPVFTKEES